MTDRNALKRGALALLVLYVLIALTFFVPYVSLVSTWFIPLPIMYVVARDGWKNALVTMGLGLILLVIIDQSFYLLFPLFFMILGFVLGFMIRLKKSAFALLLAGSLTNSAVLIIYLAISVLAYHFNPVSAAQAALNDSLQQTIAQIQPLVEQDTSEIVSIYKSQLDILVRLAPTLLIMIGVLYALIVELISLPILKRLKVETPRWVPFRLWQVPKSVIWFYLVVLFIGQIGMENGTPLNTAVINISFILQMLLAIQGFSFIYYFAHEKKFPVIVPITLTVLFLLLGALLLQLVWILGIIDLGFNLRKRISQKKS
ncbi:YybS family protein [Sporolactobacillus kofuensis]|uniref:YybS family protein n=1 Tax=Sporolactobacillus kofuensis TaxID=269672 RepID=A0ABW1WBM9_9BACL|nr:YybS family protein [Sporolactobacillus kofuensis]MCO7175249.1 YybS family protein [Sporolactobacillus kofuensis]